MARPGTREVRRRVGPLVPLWMLLLFGVSLFTYLTTDDDPDRGAGLFGVIVFLTLALGAVLTPSLSAGSFDPSHTRRVLAAWTRLLALVAGAAPFLGWAALRYGRSPAGLAATVLVLAAVLLVFALVGVSLSAFGAGLLIGLLTLGLPVVFLLSLGPVTSFTTVEMHDPVMTETQPLGYEVTGCSVDRARYGRPHTERTWWLLAPDPFVIVADVAPVRDPVLPSGLLGSIRGAARQARYGVRSDVVDRCGPLDARGVPIDVDRARRARPVGTPLWPWGLAFDAGLALSLGALTTHRQHRAPGRLPARPH